MGERSMAPESARTDYPSGRKPEPSPSTRATHGGAEPPGSATICSEPNKFARPARLELHQHSAVFHGYQEFTLTRHALWVSDDDPALKRKQELLSRFMCPSHLASRSVLDLGANSGFFSFWAIQGGARSATAVDMDHTYLRMVEEARSRLGFSNLTPVYSNVADWNEPADVVLALALVHWIYSCTATMGSLDSVIGKLADLTKYMLVVEWVDPEDPAIGFFHHIDWNKELAAGPYTLDAFEAALAHHFVRHELIGDVSSTRRLYVAFKTRYEVDLSGPLPLVLPAESVVSSRCLVAHDGTEYWSRVYDAGEAIWKQTTLDLARREAHFLSQLDSEYFPRVLESRSEAAYSLAVIEKISGTSLEEAREPINANLDSACTFVQHCLRLLGELESRGIAHRDIRPANMMVRDGKPVLLDFGWAISDARPNLTPEPLGATHRPPDRSFCDVYSMGKVLERVVDERFQRLQQVIELMTERDPTSRVTDLATLRLLVAVAARSSTVDEGGAGVSATEPEPEEAQREPSPAYDLTIRQLLDQISWRNERLAFLEAENERLSASQKETERALQSTSAQLAERERALQDATTRITRITSSTSWHLLEVLWRVRVWLAPRGSSRERAARLGTRVLRTWRREGFRAILRNTVRSIGSRARRIY